MQYTYEEVLRKIEGSRRFGKMPGVSVTAHMLSALGLSGLSLPYIHVAGTNGKGSVCAFLRSIMQEAGRRTGCFTSPHLIDFRERITVGGEMIGREDVTRLGNRLLALAAELPPEAEPTMFDYCLLLAVLYFVEQDCDIAIIETGLGGRLDSTNALGRPEAAVITRIGYDHTAILGGRLTEIAAEKAGILKEGVPAVFARQEEEALSVLLAGARDAYVITEADILRAAGYAPGLQGAYQYENAAVAEAAARLVLSQEEQACIPEGIRRARWPGRMQILSEEPFFMVDGAHNSTGARALRESLAQMFPGEKFHFVMGVMADKDYGAMVDILGPAALDFVAVTPQSERALPAEALADRIRDRGYPASCADSVREVCAHPEGDARTVAFGSLYFIGELLQLMPSGCTHPQPKSCEKQR